MASNFYKAGAAAMTSNKDDWETPQSLFDQLDEEFHFTLDAASNDQNAKCEHHYTVENSGLEHSWEGETVFCNPPYGRNIGDWIRKASQEASKPDTLVVLLVPACVCSIESGPCERVDVFHVSGRFWSTSACGEKRTPARPAWTSFPS